MDAVKGWTSPFWIGGGSGCTELSSPWGAAFPTHFPSWHQMVAPCRARTKLADRSESKTHIATPSYEGLTGSRLAEQGYLKLGK